jgi:hypothetical protein
MDSASPMCVPCVHVHVQETGDLLDTWAKDGWSSFERTRSPSGAKFVRSAESLLLFALFLAACELGRVGEIGVDSGNDAGADADAGSRSSDADAVADTGSGSPDAAAVADAGRQSPDAGAVADAEPQSNDAGTTPEGPDSGTKKSMIDYFKPIPIIGTMTTAGSWAYTTVGSRDPSNGLEDVAKWRYWDGKIIKGADGRYHLFCSKWQASKGIAAWLSDSVSVHAVSDSALGPYREVGPTYTYQNGRGHNTTGLQLVDGSYAVIESAIVPGWIFTSSSLDGPFKYQGSISWDDNGFGVGDVTSNLQVFVGPDRRYWAISGAGAIMNSDNVLGKYTVQTSKIYLQNPGADLGKAEDPIIWYSGGYFHVVYNYWNIRKSYHIMSKDGIHNWITTGLAVDRSTDFIRYTDGTVNHWGNMERPNVVMENGHVAYFTFAVTDINKDEGNNCCSTGSKILVVPFDGVAFDADNGGEPVNTGGRAGHPADR